MVSDMKRIIILLLCLIAISGCNKVDSIIINDYSTSYNNIELKPGIFFNNILATIGEYNSYRIGQSNYYEGEATIYEYDTFEIETYYDNNIEKVYSITFTSNNQITNEGVRIGDSKKKMLNIYKNDYTNIEDNVFVYNLSNTNLSFVIDNDIIIGIVYYLS